MEKVSGFFSKNRKKKGKASEALNGRILRGFLKIFLETNTLLPGHSLENCSHHSDCIVLNSQIIFHISVALRPEHSAYSIAQKRSCNRVNIFWLNRKTSWCHEQRTYVRHLGGKLCNYPVRLLSLSLSLSLSQLLASHPVFARSINSSEIEICAGLNRNSRDCTFLGAVIADARQPRFSKRRSSSDRERMTRTCRTSSASVVS